MFVYTMSTPADRAYRLSRTLTIESRDEGAAVYKQTARGLSFVGTIVNLTLVRP